MRRHGRSRSVTTQTTSDGRPFVPTSQQQVRPRVTTPRADCATPVCVCVRACVHVLPLVFSPSICGSRCCLADANRRKAELQTIIAGIDRGSSWALPPDRANKPRLSSAILPLCDDADTHVRLLACKALSHLKEGPNPSMMEALRRRASDTTEARMIVRVAADKALALIASRRTGPSSGSSS
jgi:hypothetical protein